MFFSLLFFFTHCSCLEVNYMSELGLCLTVSLQHKKPTKSVSSSSNLFLFNSASFFQQHHFLKNYSDTNRQNVSLLKFTTPRIFGSLILGKKRRQKIAERIKVSICLNKKGEYIFQALNKQKNNIIDDIKTKVTSEFATTAFTLSSLEDLCFFLF